MKMDPARPVQDVGYQCIVVALLGQLQGVTEVGAGNANLAGVERGPSGQIVQVGDGDAEPFRDQAGGVGAEHLQTRGQVANRGVVAGTAAVLVVQGTEGPVRILYCWTSATPIRPGASGGGWAAVGDVFGSGSDVDMTSPLTGAE
ncbi:MAG: hypothetical protein ACRDTA_18390 [Pseudonocardiaceae bacterium]